MSLLSENMRYLRSRLGYSQQRVADDLIISRGRYGKYEDAATEPPIEILMRIAKYYKISIDQLLSVEVRTISVK